MQPSGGAPGGQRKRWTRPVLERLSIRATENGSGFVNPDGDNYYS